MSLKSTLHSFGRSFKIRVSHLNLFQSGNQDKSIIKNEQRTTRLYLFLLIVSVVMIGLYYTFISYSHTYVHQSPTFNDYSLLRKHFSLQCPCTRVAIRYEEFLRLKPSFHPLCQNNFLSDALIAHLYKLYEKTTNRSSSTDVHRIAVFQFQTLQRLCQLALNTLTENVKVFLQTNFIQTQLISSDDLQQQISSVVNNFIDSTPKTFIRTLNFIQNITAQSFLMTGASITSVLPRNQHLIMVGENIPYDGVKYTFKDRSPCTCSSSSANTCFGLATYKGVVIRGFYTGCYMLTALLHSTLEVVFNQTLLNILTQSSDRYSVLNSSFFDVITVESLVRQMFVTNWWNETSFEDYFHQCAPISCQYTIIQRNDFLFVLTTLISLFGGLSSALRIISSFLVQTLWPIIWKRIRQRKNRVAPIIQIVVQRNDRMRQFLKTLKQKWIELNLFTSVPPSPDATILRRQRYTTQVYVICMIVTIIIVPTFISLRSETIYVTITSPSARSFLRLYQEYPRSLHCPCSQTTFDQQLIIDIQPEYHPICSSHFISSEWIKVKFVKSPRVSLTTDDIRYQSEFHFQLLSTLCQMANETIIDSLNLFYRTTFVSNELFHPNSFQTQTYLLIEQFKRTVPVSYQRTIQLLKTNYEINQFITPMNSFFSLTILEDKDEPIPIHPYQYTRSDKKKCLSEEESSSDSCRCFSQASYECHRQTQLKEINQTFPIDGMFQTWFPLQALLKSTLECFYNQTCLSHITKFIDPSQPLINITTLNSSLLSSDERRHDRIEELVNDLFVQSWKNSSSFQSYFNQCHALTCQYFYQNRVNFIYIVTTSIGILGGINVVLYLFLPLIMKFVMKLWKYLTTRRTSQSRRTRRQCIVNLFLNSQKWITTLSLFKTIPVNNDPRIIRRNRRTTRIYLILLITAFSLLIAYTLLKQEMVTIVIEYPSLATYQQLFLEHSLTLHCPCSNMSIKYSKIITRLQPEYHEICSSIFVSEQWFQSITESAIPNSQMIELETVAHRLRQEFQALAILCQISQHMLNMSLTIFFQSDYFTAYVLTEVEFPIRIKLLIKQFKTKISTEFIEAFKLIEITNHGNQLATIYYNNWIFTAKYLNVMFSIGKNQQIPMLTRPRTFTDENQCSCGAHWNCSKLSQVPFSARNGSLYETLVGFRLGCLPFDSLLQSSLSCLYNKTCVSLMQSAFYKVTPVIAEILTSSTRLNQTIEMLLDGFFVWKWTEHVSFADYYQECAPDVCQYSAIVEYDVIYMATMLVSAFGGLTNGFHFLMKCFATVFYKIVDHRRRRSQMKLHENKYNKSMKESVTPVLDLNLIEEQRTPERIRRDRLLLVCLIFIAILAIVTASIVLVGNRKKKQAVLLSTVYSTTTTSDPRDVESTSASSKTCHMTLRYESQMYATQLDPISFAIDDFNQDSFIDIVVANRKSDTLSIMLGTGNGTFGMKGSFPTGKGSRPEEILVADFNNDRLLDLVVTLPGAKKIVIYFGVKNDNLFVVPPKILPSLKHGVSPNAIGTGDLDQDGWIDVIVSHVKDKESNEGDITYFLNVNGYQKVKISKEDFYISNLYISFYVGDFNNEEKGADVALMLMNGDIDMYRFSRDSISESYFLYRTTLTTSEFGYASKIIVGKFNGDAIDDLAYVFPESNILHVLVSYPTTPENLQFTQILYLTGTHPTSVAVINFNNDGNDDLAILHCNGLVTIFVGTDVGLFDRQYLSFKTDVINGRMNKTCFQSLHVIDLNQDDRDDLIFIDNEMNSIRVILASPCTKQELKTKNL
ncbi:unnamed protein product [Adineta ricciae]|uniref:Uncharacterized protein n=1 Tax=Adineta ricciae TaxID=249248 RepID=A0A814QI02_ADIRI|nr:unnamed protein product [Adineta ricciae]CAF1514492.1 unnamed protein product [Adineta ricciae]